MTLSFLKARYSDESGDMFTSDVENERDDEDSVCNPGDLSESRVGPPDLTKTQSTLCQIGVLGGLSHPQVGQIGDE